MVGEVTSLTHLMTKKKQISDDKLEKGNDKDKNPDRCFMNKNFEFANYNFLILWC